MLSRSQATATPIVRVPVVLPARASTVVRPDRRTRRPNNLAVSLGFGVVVLAAAFFRLYALDRHGFNSDEAVYAGTAASIAGTRRFLDYFPIYRAHPLLFQTMVATVFRFIETDFAARVLSAAFGIGSVMLTYALGARLYGRRAGLFAAALLAVMPYHVVVSRQVLLDGPQVFFTTLVLYCLVRYTTAPTRMWMLALAGSLGLAFLTKETSVLVVGSAVTYLALNRQVRVRFVDLVAGGALFVVMAIAYPIATASGGAASAGGSFVVWQLLRRPNHGYDFYPGVAGPAIGIVVLLTAVIGLVMLRRRWSWRETLLLCWIGVPDFTATVICSDERLPRSSPKSMLPVSGGTVPVIAHPGPTWKFSSGSVTLGMVALMETSPCSDPPVHLRPVHLPWMAPPRFSDTSPPRVNLGSLSRLCAVTLMPETLSPGTLAVMLVMAPDRSSAW